MNTNRENPTGSVISKRTSAWGYFTLFSLFALMPLLPSTLFAMDTANVILSKVKAAAEKPGCRLEVINLGLSTRTHTMQQKINIKRNADGSEMRRVYTLATPKSRTGHILLTETIIAHGEIWYLYPRLRLAVRAPQEIANSYTNDLTPDPSSLGPDLGATVTATPAGKNRSKLTIALNNEFISKVKARFKVHKHIPQKLELIVDNTNYTVLSRKLIADNGAVLTDYTPSSVRTNVKYSDGHFSVPSNYRKIYTSGITDFLRTKARILATYGRLERKEKHS